ncbi:hypothetical protein F5Y06DRAFT_288220 [Hypoxylon sp. FL0890]|nr:hypothetical protein F5Y06DRAFT_288220 [Hypoxylon sp. FL0890]
MSPQDLARSLVAAGSVKLPGDEGQGIYLLSVRDGNLVEKHWVGDDLQSEIVVASDVRDNTSAAYLLDLEQSLRLIVFIDQENVIQCYKYDDDIEEWEETPLGSTWNITTNPESKLSATMDLEGGIVVSYQDETGHLAGIMSVADNEWKSFGPLKGNPVLGTPQCLEVIDDKLHLFYVEKDAGIGYLVLDPDTGNWQVNLLKNTKFDAAIDNFSVVEDPETGSFQSYILAGGSLWNIDGDKKQTCLGKVEDDGKLVPSDQAQAGWRIRWRGARKIVAYKRKCRRKAIAIQAMGSDVEDFEDFDLETFELPTELYHSTQRSDEPPKPERFGIDLSTPPRRWEDWVVKLTFEKSGQEKHGSGFYVNVPNATFDVILTAGHNLVEKEQQYCSNIRILNDPFAKTEIPVTPEMIRVCQRYLEDPDELNAIYDYGVILLKRDKNKRMRGFGFNLMLGLAPLPGENTDSPEDEEKDLLQNREVYVSGYRPGDSPLNDPPRRSEGKCIRTNAHQLYYQADTIQGMSGGPVWIGFRGVETVVAIHNYGEESKGQGNRGSRLNLNVWRTIFEWVGVGWHDKSLHYRGPKTYSMHLHLPQTFQRDSDISNEGRVRVGKPGRVDTVFDILPVASKPKAKELDAGYGFLLRPMSHNGGTTRNLPPTSPFNWVRWDPKKGKVSLTRRFDGRCEVKLPPLIAQSGKPFAIQARDGDCWKQVRMDMKRLDEGDLELLGDDPQNFEDTSEISFVSLTKDKPFELK